MFSLLCFIAATITTQAFASAAVTSLGAIHSLTKRQSDDTFDPNVIPIQCKAQCALISDTLSRCEAKPVIGCSCNLADESALVTCLNCMLALVSTPSQTLIDEAQAVVDNHIAACASVGFPLPATKVAGASPTVTVTRPGGVSATAAAGDTLTINTFQPRPTGAGNPGPSDSGDSDDETSVGSGNGPLAGMNSAASRAEVGVTSVVLSAAVYVIFF